MSPLPWKQDIPPGSNVDVIRGELSSGGVSAPLSQRATLEKVVDRALDHGLILKVVVLPAGNYVPTQLRNLATEVADSGHVTVLALAPGFVGSYSTDISRVRLENAQDELDGNSTIAANQFVDRLLTPELSWNAVTGFLTALVLVSVGVARLSHWPALVRGGKKSRSKLWNEKAPDDGE